MEIAVALIWGLLLHFVGDYLFQTSWMANEKTKSHFPAFIHALVYSLPFLIIVPSWEWLIIFVTHFFIDRHRLAVYWIKLLNNGWKSENYGYPNSTPIWLSTWLLFIVDNTIHNLINLGTITLYYR